MAVPRADAHADIAHHLVEARRHGAAALFAAPPVIIDIQTIIDTDKVIAKYPKGGADAKSALAIGHADEYLLVTNSRGAVKNNGTADVEFVAYVRDTVAFHSYAANGVDSVIMADITPQPGNPNVFAQFKPVVYTIEGFAQPNNDGSISYRTDSVITFEAQVVTPGTENFWVVFSLYEYVPGTKQQNPRGFYKWDPKITVQ